MNASLAVNIIQQKQLKVLQVLVVDNSEQDYNLLVDKIRDEGFDIISRRVETQNNFNKALSEHSWDLIISNDHLPSFDTSKALSLVSEINPSLPLIVVSRSHVEGTTVNTVSSGTDDHTHQSNVARLIPVVHRVIKNHEHRMDKGIIQNQLQNNQDNYQLLANHVQDLVCLHDTNGDYQWISPSVTKILGYTPNELIKAGAFYGIHPEDKNHLTTRIFGAIESGKVRNVQRFNYRRRRKDGIYIYLETLAEPVYEKNCLIKIVSTTRDVTEQTLSSQLLEENQARYEGVLESLSEGIVLINYDGIIITYNKSAQKMLDIPNRDYIGISNVLETNFQLLQKDHKPFDIKHFPSTITAITGLGQHNKVIGLKKNDQIRWASVTTVPYKLSASKKGVVLSINDITQVYQSEEKAQKVAAELVSLIETANAPIFGINWYGKITEWNNYATKVTGFSKEEVLGKSLLQEFIADGHREIVKSLFKKILRGKNATNYELPMVTRGGQTVTMLFNGTPRRDYENRIVGMLGVGQDITELIDYRDKLESKVEERTIELQEALKKEKELVSLKSKFVSMASHEFRTPLTTIQFASDFIKNYGEKKGWDAVHVKLNKVDEQIRHMTHLLDDVLVMGKSQAGMIKVNRSLLSVSEFCHKIIEEVSYQTGYTHTVEDVIISDTDTIFCDEKLMRNILINLLNNAIKFSPKGDRVRLEVTCKKGALRVLVKDWGLGIEKEEREKIFEAFHRSDRVSGIYGTGLGLSIVKKAVEILDGTITVESVVKKGTTFIVTLPVDYEKENISN
ncbi:PAS domain S-box protein [Fulvivirga sp. M361]|uniref:PAS domain S-box protein n=1 Tax=Fulvivirga sp. M361 TaxID=2594266 RepID=UPI00117B4E74|nr:PAS domain S-box protein [Fulvivirga sp. M361]TRX51864.1 PAS domain S-box protein [Fulvivirga sp. M361]